MSGLSVRDRIEQMKEDSEAWKTKQRHSARMSTVLDAPQVSEVELASGHTVRRVGGRHGKLGMPAGGDDSEDSDDPDPEVEAKMLYDNEEYTGTKGFAAKKGGRVIRKRQQGAAAAAASAPGGEGSDDSDTEPELDPETERKLEYSMADAPEARSTKKKPAAVEPAPAADDTDSDGDLDPAAEKKLLYSIANAPEAGGQGPTESTPTASGGGDSGNPGGDDDGADDSDLDPEAEQKMLYDNEEYTGTKGFAAKKGGRVIRKKRGEETA